MLALSSLVRAIHVELRYAIPFLNIEDQSSAFQENFVTSVRQSSLLQEFFELMTWPEKDERLLGQHLPKNYPLRLRKSVFTNIRSSL